MGRDEAEMNRSPIEKDDLATYLEARNKAMLEMDFDFVRNKLGRPVSDEMCELTLHKARYACTALPAEARHASAKWLRDHNYKSMSGEDILPEGASCQSDPLSPEESI